MYVAPATDRLPHEPMRVRARAPLFVLRLAAKSLWVAVLGVAVLPLWLPFLVGCAVYGWPPHVARGHEFARYMRAVLTERPPDPGLAPLTRTYLFVHLWQRLWLAPVAGLAWFADEVLFRRALREHPVRAPLLLLSAARSGSTQISRYLEDDPRLAAPNVLQILAPYLWLWTLARPVARLLTIDRIRRWLDAFSRRILPIEFVQRHEVDPLRTDTFEMLYFGLRLHALAPCLGPRHLAEEMGFSSRVARNAQMWAQHFPDFIDRLGRKTLAFAGPAPGGGPRRFYIKGHFQSADDVLAARYPDAHFVTVVRDPAKRLASFINHVHGNPFFESLGAIPWSWLAEALPDAETAYNRREMDWYSRAEGPARTVVRFRDYVDDLEGTMVRIYARCMGDDELPAYVPRVHAPRERTQYVVDRGLDDLGIDAASFAADHVDFRAWCAGRGSRAA